MIEKIKTAKRGENKYIIMPFYDYNLNRYTITVIAYTPGVVLNISYEIETKEKLLERLEKLEEDKELANLIDAVEQEIKQYKALPKNETGKRKNTG